VNKRIILTILAVFLFLNVFAYTAEEPTQREWNIYYDFVEKSSFLRSQNKSAVNYTFEQIADDHGISLDELMRIVEKTEIYGLKPEEQKIVEELGNKLTALGNNATEAQKDAVYQEIGRKYGLSLARVVDLTIRAVAWMTY
jgi:hypothetical protein